MVDIRLAASADVPGIAHVHVSGWRTTYAGLMPDEVLANLSVEGRANFWQQWLSQSDRTEFLYVAEDQGQIMGLASGGPQREGHYPAYAGELYAIYLLAEWQGRGIGRQLVQAVTSHLLKNGITSMLLWVLHDNHPARKFYEALGGRRLGEKTAAFGSATLVEVAYAWEDIHALAAPPFRTKPSL